MCRSRASPAGRRPWVRQRHRRQAEGRAGSPRLRGRRPARPVRRDLWKYKEFEHINNTTFADIYHHLPTFYRIHIGGTEFFDVRNAQNYTGSKILY